MNFSKKVTKEAFKEEKQIADEKKVGEVLEKNNKNQDNKDPKLPKIYYNQVDGYPSVGSKNALVTIVEYSDYQCPYCRRAQSTLKKIIDNYDGKVRVVWKDNPLGFHKNAMPTAQIGWLIFKEKGEKAFRKARDMFYNNYRELTTEKLISIAKEFGISDDKVRETIKNKIFVDKINKSQTEGNKVGARGTPTFFINGRILNGAQPYNNFKKIVDEELEKAEAMVKKGSSPSKVYDEIMDRAERKFVRTPRKNRVQKKDDNKIYDIAQNDHSPYWGEKKAKVTIIEFSEFQCPFCKRVVPVLHKLKKKYGNKIRIEFRHLPLSFHKYAMNAAKASMAAYKQGQFWQMHDLLFANNKELTEDDLIGYANKLGLNINQFESDMKDSAIEKMIKNDMEVASKVGARGTPTFFINGKKLVGARPYTDFEQAVEDALKRVDK